MSTEPSGSDPQSTHSAAAKPPEETTPLVEPKDFASHFEQQGNVGCMLVLAFLILLAPFVFLFSFVILMLLVALFGAWLVQLVTQPWLLPKASKWKVLLFLWMLVSAVLFIGAFMLGKFGDISLSGGRY